MHAAEMSFGISGNHLLQRAAADQLKTAAGINSRDKIAFLLTLRFGAKGSDIGQGSLLYALAALDTALRNEIPIDRLERVQRPGKVLTEPQQPLPLLRFEADIGIDEQQMGDGIELAGHGAPARSRQTSGLGRMVEH